MAKMTMKEFEKSKFDKEPKGVKEGSKEDKALDKKQLAEVNKKYAKGGQVSKGKQLGIDGAKKGAESKFPMKAFAKGGQVSKGKQLGIDGAKKGAESKFPMKAMAKGGKVCGKAEGGVMRGTGAAKKGTRFSYDG